MNVKLILYYACGIFMDENIASYLLIVVLASVQLTCKVENERYLTKAVDAKLQWSNLKGGNTSWLLLTESNRKVYCL